MGKHSFSPFTRSDFSFDARIFWLNGYRTVGAIKDMDPRERDLFLSQVKSDSHSSRNRLADLRLILRIFAWFEPHGRLRDPHHGVDEIDTNRWMRDWAVSLPGITGILQPEQEMANRFPTELERGRTSRPPYTPYVTVDTLNSFPWMPPGEPHRKALDRWKAIQVTFHRNTGGQYLSLGQYALYRVKYILAGDLASAWSEYGGLTAQINNMANVLEISIEDNAGVSITYDYRILQHIRKLAHRRATNTDYIDILSTTQPDIRAAVTRDIEAAAEASRKAKETEKATKEKGKERPNWRERAPGKGATGRETDSAPDKDTGRKGKRWAEEDWAAWRKKMDESKAEARSPAPDATKDRKEKKK